MCDKKSHFYYQLSSAYVFEVISEAHIGNILHLVINHILVGKQVLQVAHSIRDTTFFGDVSQGQFCAD